MLIAQSGVQLSASQHPFAVTTLIARSVLRATRVLLFPNAVGPGPSVFHKELSQDLPFGSRVQDLPRERLLGGRLRPRTYLIPWDVMCQMKVPFPVIRMVLKSPVAENLKTTVTSPPQLAALGRVFSAALTVPSRSVRTRSPRSSPGSSRGSSTAGTGGL